MYFYRFLKFHLLCLTRQCMVMRVECGTVLALASENHHLLMKSVEEVELKFRVGSRQRQRIVWRYSTLHRLINS